MCPGKGPGVSRAPPLSPAVSEPCMEGQSPTLSQVNSVPISPNLRGPAQATHWAALLIWVGWLWHLPMSEKSFLSLRLLSFILVSWEEERMQPLVSAEAWGRAVAPNEPAFWNLPALRALLHFCQKTWSAPSPSCPGPQRRTLFENSVVSFRCEF